MFVFGEIQDPNPETVNLVEDIVRSQLIELVSDLYFNDEIHCDMLCHYRFYKPASMLIGVVCATLPQRISSSSFATTAVRSTVSGHISRGRTFVSMPKTRAVKEGAALRSKISRMALMVRISPKFIYWSAHVRVEKLTTKAQKITIKLPWEISTIYSEVLRQSGHQSDDEEDEDDIEAHEASIQRLKEADDATRQMTREEYQHYSDCRQASFTYRKGEIVS